MFLICSNCFENEGLKLLAEKLSAIDNNSACGCCGRAGGKKLNIELVEELMEEFFINGTVNTSLGGFEPVLKSLSRDDVLQMDADDLNKQIEKTWVRDYKLLSRLFDKSVRRNAPRLNRLGQTLFTDDLYAAMDTAKKEELDLVLDRLIDSCSLYNIKEQTKIYRIRINPSGCLEEEFDSPPLGIIAENGRLNDKNESVFYAALDPETCMYECRIKVEDETVLATFEANQNIELLDLENIEDKFYGTTWGIAPFVEFEFASSDYLYTNMIAKRAKERGYAGLKYHSFFSKVRDGSYSNIAIFGRPLSGGLLSLKSLNRIRLYGIKFDYTYGPIVG